MREATLSPAIPQLPSGDIDVTAEFFVRKLGFQIVAKFVQYGHLIVQRGQAEIHFWQAATEAAAKAIGNQSSCYIRVENIEALYTELQRNGAAIRYGLTLQPWGMNEMQVDDPYGNAIRFGERSPV
jgi:uncharacterized glyoxalase superfamily protein PhnB